MVLLQAGGKLDIKNVKVGSGPGAANYDLLSMNYTGKLTNGTVFDTSLQAGRPPFRFVLGAGLVIKGWDQGILGMKVGGKRILTIPPDLAYGAGGTPDGKIPKNATLKFEVDLLGIHKCSYTILKKGTGPGAKTRDKLELQYTGMFTNGKKFDSSYDHHQTMKLVLGDPRLVPGFTQALYGMKVGEKRRVTIPPDYAYGSRPIPDRRPGAKQGAVLIPANSTLIFELELVGFGQ